MDWWKKVIQKLKAISPKLLKWLRRVGLGLAGLSGVVLIVSLAGWFYFWPPQFFERSMMGETCARCHVIEPYLDTMDNSNFLVHDHLREGVQCLECHDRSFPEKVSETITYLNLNGDFRSQLRRYKYPQEKCLDCHAHGSYEQIAWITTDLGVTDDQAGGTFANPHQAHFAKLECHVCHRMHERSEDFCAECHKYDWDVP